MYSVNGNVASWRSPGLSAENFKLGPMEALGTTYITTTSSGAVVTIAPKAGVTFPQGMVIKYSGNVLYKTEGGANPNGNLWPTGNFTYTYGSNCSAIILTELDKPTNVSIDADGLLTFDPVANADNYIAYVYLGTTLVYQQATMQIGDKLNFPLPGNFNVTVVANPAPTNMGTYASSQPSDPYEWSVVWDMPATVAQSVYCDYLVNPTGGNSLGGGNTPDDDSYWKWETDAEGQIVITIVRPEVADYAATTSFRAGGMQVGNFKIGGVSGTLLLDKVTPNGLYTTQVFKAKPGITLLPGLGITYSGQVEYRITDADHNGTDAGAINDLYPTLTFSTPFIYGSNCSGTATVLGTPQNLTIADNKLSFDAVTDATSYTVFIAAKDGTLVNTIPNFTSGQELVYDAPGYYDVKVQAIGNGSTFVSGDRSAATEWKKIAKLGTPTDLYVSLDNKLSFASVPAAEAYTVYVYDQAAATTAVVTLPNFVAGSTVAMGDKPYGTYYIKVQATGDNDVKLDGDLSAALTWEFAEPCNMLNDYPPRLGTESDTWTKPDGTTQTGAPYFAPGWAPSTNYSVEYSASGVKIHLGSATSADWQAQFRFLTTPTLPLDATKQYTITLRVKTSKSTPVYCKLFDKDDNVFIEVVPRQAINAPEGRLFTLENVRLDGTASGLQNVFQIYFDFGGNPADVDITLSDYLICEKEIPAAPLATPTGLAVSPDNKLSFNAVQYASSYKVFVYDQAAATTPVVTLENFAIGSVIDMGSKAYGTYYVKVQAIGDGVLNLDSELSAALEWNYAEPCNLFLDNPVRLGTTEDTFTKPDGTAANCAPYVAQGWEWAASTNYTAIIDNGIVKIHLGDATVADWQAQFRLLPTPMLALNQSDEYTFSVKVKTSSDATVYSKLFQYDDNKFIEPIVRQKVNNTTKVFTWTGKANGLENVFQVLFDLAPSPANTNVEISDFTLCNKKSGMVYDLISGLVISPNPAKDVLNIHGLTKATRVTISSVSGKQIMSVITGGLIDVSTLPAGVYLLQVDGKTTKFIKK
jgi:hypothetical protein